MTLLAFLSSNHKNIAENLPFWRAFDNTHYFSIDHPTQKRYILYTGLICLPTILSGYLEIDWFIKFLLLKHTDGRRYMDSICPYLDQYVNVFLSLINCISILLRYIPVMNMLFAIICIRKHLSNLSTQLDATCKEDFDLLALKDINSKSYQHTNRSVNHFGVVRETEWRPDDGGRIAASSSTSRSGSRDYRNLTTQPNDYANERNTVDSRKTKLTITNLHELESHLTKLSLFIKQIDVDSSLVVFITIFYHSAVLFYTIFLFREFTLDFQQFLFIIYNFFGLMPLLSIFLMGTLMEREAKSVMTKLEYMYLQEETQCFMYRQMSGMKYPLWSIFKLLGSIEFTCDQLMHVNLSTLQDICILLGASAFVVIQYGEYWRQTIMNDQQMS